MTLSNYINDIGKSKLNLTSIYELGIKLLDMLQIVHDAGYVHNDLSLSSIAVSIGG